MARKSIFGRIADKVRKFFTGEDEVSQLAEEPVQQKETAQQEPLRQKSVQSVQQEPNSRLAEVEKMRKRFEPIIDEANRRVDLILNSGLSSAALSRAEQESGYQYFSLDDIDSQEKLIQEATRARVFLSDETSTIEGATIYTAQLNAAEFRGKFGNKYHTWEHKFKNFDTTAINEEIAKTVFSNYRKLEELRAADITGDGAYGSENLIIAMYDAQVRGEDSFMIGLEQLDAFYRKKTLEWRTRFNRANEVSDILGVYENYDKGGLYF